MSMGLKLGPIVRLMTRNLYALLHAKYVWCDMLSVINKGREELMFWAHSVDPYLVETPPQLRVVYSDASDRDYGRYEIHKAQGN